MTYRSTAPQTAAPQNDHKVDSKTVSLKTEHYNLHEADLLKDCCISFS